MRTIVTYTLSELKVQQSFKLNTLVKVFAGFLTVIVQYFIWQTIDIKMSGQYFTYTLVAVLLSMIIPTQNIAQVLAKYIQKGNIAVLLVRPSSLGNTILGIGLGKMIYALIFQVLPLIAMSLILFGKQINVFSQFPIVLIVSFILSWVIAYFFGFLIGISAILTTRVNGLMSLWLGLSTIFGGAVIPLNIYPAWLHKISEFTPFYSIFYAPLSLISGVDTSSVMNIIFAQLVWVILLGFASLYVSKKLFERLSVAGG